MSGTRTRASLIICSFVFICLAPVLLKAQDKGCSIPEVSSARRSENLFTDEMEAELGSIINYQVQLRYKTIDEPMLTSYLQTVGDRVVAAMPTRLKFHFYLVDLPEANAFSLPGGYVYVSRKLAANFRSEDELAAVLAHELGHIVTHQGAVEMSQAMRDVLKIDHLEPGEVFDRYNELMESWKESRTRSHSASMAALQGEADRVGINGLARAGYPPSVMAEFFDRFAETHGRKGSWLTDMFGTTSENSKRLREMARETSSVPVVCVEHPQKASPEQFKEWQSVILKYNGIGHRESLHALAVRKKLQPTLRADLEQIRISRDGKYFLAQDENSITLFSRDGNKNLLVIEAPNARPAQFSPDSRQVSFYVSEAFGSPRVETWNIEDQSHDVYEVYEHRGCLQTALSPDGKTFACLTLAESPFVGVKLGLAFDLHVRRVEDDEIIYENRGFFVGQFFTSITALYSALHSHQEITVAQMEFSPNGKVLLIGRQGKAFGFDVPNRKVLSLDGNIKRVIQTSFTFLDDNRIIGVESDASMLVGFPDGKVLADQLQTGVSHMTGAAKGDYVMLRPIQDHEVGVFSIKENKIIIALKNRAVDVYGDSSIREIADGQLMVNSITDGKVLATIQMPDTLLAGLKSSGASSDLKFLALSGKTRGGVWDVEQNQRPLYLRGFKAAHFESPTALLLEFFEKDKEKGAIGAFTLQPPIHAEKLREVDGEKHPRHFGKYLVLINPEKEGGRLDRDVKLEIHDFRTNDLVWSRFFPKEAPSVHLSRSAIILRWTYEDAPAREALEKYPELVKNLKRSGARKGACYLEMLEPTTGNVVGRALLDTGNGSFRPEEVFKTSDRLFIGDNNDRVLVYTSNGDKLIGRLLGNRAWLSPDGKLLAVQTGRGRISFYDTESLKMRDQLDFSSHVSMLWFGREAKTLQVLTSDQTLFRFDINRIGNENLNARDDAQNSAGKSN
jgi:WD40 repeat protein